MSNSKELDISLALEEALQEIVDNSEPQIQTSDENVKFEPISGVPYQNVNILFGEPENPTLGGDFHRIKGFLQVSLKYPLGQGKAPALTRAGLIKNHFKKGLSFSKNEVTAIISDTPEIRKGENLPDRYVINVYIKFFANIGD